MLEQYRWADPPNLARPSAHHMHDCAGILVLLDIVVLGLYRAVDRPVAAFLIGSEAEGCVVIDYVPDLHHSAARPGLFPGTGKVGGRQALDHDLREFHLAVI